MSMREEMRQLIRERCEAGELKLVEPTIPCQQVRPVYMAKALWEQCFGEKAENTKRMGFLEADLRNFINGDKVTVARELEKTCILKPLSDVDGVWEFRSRGPKPGIRIFGRFADKDVLVATNMEYRKLLFAIRSRQFAVQIRSCQTIWTRLFPYMDPHRGETAHDYVSNAIDLDCDVP